MKMAKFLKALLGLTALSSLEVNAFSAVQPGTLTARSSLPPISKSIKMAAGDTSDFNNADAPPLKRAPPRKIALFIEPTPFTHVSGYSNRFIEMLRFLQKAGDKVEIVTTDEHSDPNDLPKEKFGFPIAHTLGFTFPLYKQITLTFDLPDLKGYKMIDRLKPDLIHVTSP